MDDLFQNAGLFIYPLGLCSVVAVFIIIERLLFLRSSAIAPTGLMNQLVKGDISAVAGDNGSVGGRLIKFYRESQPDADSLKAYAQLEVTKLERGLFLLDVVVGAAPLLGLLGTVAGLIKVFANFSPEAGMPDPGLFVEGVAMALSTTMVGLAVAIPALAASHWLYRRVDVLSARVGVVTERLVQLSIKEGE